MREGTTIDVVKQAMKDYLTEMKFSKFHER